jgi:hypothetical protein
VAIYFTLSSLTKDADEPMRCLCGTYAFPRDLAGYFDCASCGQRWWALAPGIMLQQLEKARAAV